MTILSRLTDAELRRALERAAGKEPFVLIDDTGPGFVRASTACAGTCPAHEFLAGRHDVLITWQGIGTCDCGATRGLCWHIASVLTYLGGQLPEPPPCGPERGCGMPILYNLGGNGHACELATDPTADPPASLKGVAPLPTAECKELCRAAPEALWTDGGNGHANSCPHADDEQYRRTNPYERPRYVCQVGTCGMVYLSARAGAKHAREAHATGDFTRTTPRVDF